MIKILNKSKDPLKSPKDSERITFRLDAKTSEILKLYCEQEGLKNSEAIRIGISQLKKSLRSDKNAKDNITN